MTPEQNTEQNIRHLFVETNWLHGYAAPAHHKVPAAVTLLERAQRGDFILHIPNLSFAEARQSIQTKCQPVDGPGVHRYIRWAHKNGELNDNDAELTAMFCACPTVRFTVTVCGLFPAAGDVMLTVPV